MEELNQLTRTQFNFVDESRHALGEVTLPEHYATTINQQQRVGSSKMVSLMQ